MVLVGITHDDTEDDAAYLADKVVNLRIFDDSEGKMNLSLVDIGGEILSVSQFTLYGDTKKGRRPNYMNAAKPDKASFSIKTGDKYASKRDEISAKNRMTSSTKAYRPNH